MLFSNITFIYYFLPCVLILYFITPTKLKNTVLLIESLIFYAWSGPEYILLITIGIITGYISGLIIEKYYNISKIVLVIQTVFSLGLLGYFKYANFFIANFNTITGSSKALLKIVLPVGISFYTFQILSYVIDVYRQNVKAQRSLINFALYVSLFPQLIAGPIVRYSDIASQIEKRSHSIDKISYGIRNFVFGLAKKVLIANNIGELCEYYNVSNNKSVIFCWMYAVSYTLQIYYDFSGYSDMARGLGRIFGFELCENFRYPYISKSITEFWRRWHMSLGTWFRDYVYIPLGGNRVSKRRNIFNIFVVWTLTGLWHGASWNFVIWGFYFAVFLVIEKIFLLKHLEKMKIVNHIYVLFSVIISFVIFSSDSIKSIGELLGGMFGLNDFPLISAEQIYYFKSFKTILIIACIGATPLPLKLIKKLPDTKAMLNVISIAEPIILVLLTLITTAYLVDGSFNPFLYFRF